MRNNAFIHHALGWITLISGTLLLSFLTGNALSLPTSAAVAITGGLG